MGEDTLAIIGDNTTLRECVTVNRGTASKGKTVVGNNCLIMAYSHVAHDCVVGDNVIIANASQIAGEVQIDDFAVIGGGTMVHQFWRQFYRIAPSRFHQRTDLRHSRHLSLSLSVGLQQQRRRGTHRSRTAGNERTRRNHPFRAQCQARHHQRLFVSQSRRTQTEKRPKSLYEHFGAFSYSP